MWGLTLTDTPTGAATQLQADNAGVYRFDFSADGTSIAAAWRVPEGPSHLRIHDLALASLDTVGVSVRESATALVDLRTGAVRHELPGRWRRAGVLGRRLHRFGDQVGGVASFRGTGRGRRGCLAPPTRVLPGRTARRECRCGQRRRAAVDTTTGALAGVARVGAGTLAFSADGRLLAAGGTGAAWVIAVR